MADWSSYSDDAWESDGEAEPLSALTLSNLDTPGLYTLDANGWVHGEALSSSLIEEYVGKGFPKEMVLKAIKAIGNNDANALHELLLTYKALGDYPLLSNCSISGCTPHSLEDENDLDFENWDDDEGHAGVREANSDGSMAENANGWVHEEASSSLIEEYVGKGFPEEMVVKAIKANGNIGANALHELLLTYKALSDYPLLDNCSTSGSTPHNLEDKDDIDFENWDDDDDHPGVREANSDCSFAEDLEQELLQKDKNIKSLVDVGFHEDEANMIITRCGVGVSFFLLVDDSSNYPHHEVTDMSFNSFGGRKKETFKEQSKKKRKCYGDREQGSQPPVGGSHDKPMPLPNPMVGFNLPNDMVRSVNRRLPKQAIGPPFFYYENVAKAPKGVWGTISRNLYGVEPEFVDSKHLCAAARKRGYVHNLPIENRAPLHPAPPKTIFEAFPECKAWWPSWDLREQLNCLTTCVQAAKQSQRVGRVLARADNPPCTDVKRYVMDKCKKYNLVWVGKNKVAHLDAHEMEKLLGFPYGHTKGVIMTERYESLGNSFHVDTVAYHLSVLRDMFPDGIKLLSLFTGIGGAEVALHRLGIHMRSVVSVEISKSNRSLFRSWWKQTQTGQLIEIEDVQTLTDDIVESLTRNFGGFDLVIGGSPCNNLAGKNRFDRTGLDGKLSALFYHYVRILDAVKSVMATM